MAKKNNKAIKKDLLFPKARKKASQSNKKKLSSVKVSQRVQTGKVN